MSFYITIEEAAATGYCPTCNFAGRKEKELKSCNYHSHPSLNYLKIPEGKCALKPFERDRRRKEYRTDKNGRIIKSRKRGR